MSGPVHSARKKSSAKDSEPEVALKIFSEIIKKPTNIM